MLIDPETSDMARYALERIPGEGVDAVLRDTLPKTKGVEKIGIISTLGLRADSKSVPVLAALIKDTDAEVAAAAVAALGQITGPEAHAALAAAKDTTTGDLQMLVLDAYLNCADRLVDAGENEEALKIYRELYTSDIPEVIRSAPSGAASLRFPKRQAKIILEVIRAGDAAIRKSPSAWSAKSERGRHQDSCRRTAQTCPRRPGAVDHRASRGSAIGQGCGRGRCQSDNADVRAAYKASLRSAMKPPSVCLPTPRAARWHERLAAQPLQHAALEVDATILGPSRSPRSGQSQVIPHQPAQHQGTPILLKTAVDPSDKVQLEAIRPSVGGRPSTRTLVTLLTGVKTTLSAAKRNDRCPVAAKNRCKWRGSPL